MRYLQIPDQLINSENQIYDLIWPNDATTQHDYILHRNVYLIPEDHANITFIMLRLQEHTWYDDDSGPVKFIRYA